ncbi:MAG: putative cytochrome c [Pseudoduganella sp.]|jgi:cytochrome c5|nr:putative cytochrome c [Pseudoduganella sp.]
MRPASALLAACGLLASFAAPAQPAGRAVYEAVCIACHAVENVMVSAPKLGDRKAWQERSERAGGMQGLVRNAAQGFGAMPPKGGRDDLSEAQLRAAIRYMQLAD